MPIAVARPSPRTYRLGKAAVRLWLLMLPLELGAIYLSYWTLGWGAAFVFAAGLVVVNAFAFLLRCAEFWPGVALALFFGFSLTGYQSVLGVRWFFVNDEARSIIRWAKSEEIKTGKAPVDLGGYVFRHPGYKDYLHYHSWIESDRVDWMLICTVGTGSTGYHYQPDSGWYCNDD